jgi:hypothetical protein
MKLSKLIQEFVDDNDLHPFEGDKGVENLNKVARAIGYEPHGFAYGSSLEVFLSDNPGACEAILHWMGEQNVQDWKDNIESELPEKDEQDDDEDDE